MAHFPHGIAWMVTTKRDGQQKPQVEGLFVPDDSIGYGPSNAAEDANNLLVSLYTNHSGGRTEYVTVKLEEQAHEVRPVEQ